MTYPEYVTIDGIKYNINTDFRNAIKCSSIAQDSNIKDFERALAIIYILYGEKGLQNEQHYEKLLECAKLFLSCGKPLQNTNETPDMDYEEDMDYIEASFMSDFHIDLSNEKMHWWKFNKLMNGLSNSEMGNCCVLNRVRNLRNYDVKEIKDKKERDKIIKAKESVALKKYKKENNLTKEQEESMKKFNEMIGL